jgi:cardiolipin synthase
MRPLFISKLNTTMQIILVALVLAEIGVGIRDASVIMVMQYVVALTTLASGITYAYRYVATISTALQDPSDR